MPALTEPLVLHRIQPRPSRARIALLGLGTIGSAVAELVAAPPLSRVLQITGALVRRVNGRTRPIVPLAADPADLLRQKPDVVIELLGGIEPARTCVLAALERGIPVVTANKSLIARHGEELLAAARRTNVALRYEASVLAGVPFLGTLARRPLARSVTRVVGILNGTSHFVLTQVAREGRGVGEALDRARHLGFAEADPAKDVDGTDAAEKLAILIRLLANRSVDPNSISRQRIDAIRPEDFLHAADFGGTLKPAASAAWNDGITAFVGPCFVGLDHPLARLEGVTNAVCLAHPGGNDVLFIGPGAGPRATAATVLDDVLELLANDRDVVESSPAPRCAVSGPSGQCGWFVRLDSPEALPDQREVAELLASFDVWLERTSRPSGETARWLLTHPVAPRRLAAALDALARACGCAAQSLPVLESSRV